MRHPNDEWNEYEWEKALRESDEFAHDYFKLLRRFSDLPGANELIAKHLGKHYGDMIADCNMDCDNCENQWNCDLIAFDDLPHSDENDGEGEPDDFDFDFDNEDTSFFYEHDRSFVTLRQAAIGWCNIYAAILPQEARPTGLKILYYIGRALANLAYSIGDGAYDQPAASVAFAKRASSQLNKAIGLINQLMVERPRLKKIMMTIRSHLLKANEAILDHLQQCREESQSGRN